MIRKLMSSSRLVTLVGFGGMGKTRLALRVAEDTRRAFRHGAWIVDLTYVNDSTLVPRTVAQTLGIRDPSLSAGVPGLLDYLEAREILLVLDNCEQVIDDCAKMVGELLRGCPGLRVLATSREPLGIWGEAVVQVPPLSLPNSGALTLSNLYESEAAALFRERAIAVLPGFELAERNKEAVAEICRTLEGIPLAIELAAVWLRVMSPEQILRLLTDRSRFLTKGSRTAADRHRTLAACMAWSYDLCSAAEKRLWMDLSVFAGGFELDAIAATEEPRPDRRADETDGVLLDLVTRSSRSPL